MTGWLVLAGVVIVATVVVQVAVGLAMVRALARWVDDDRFGQGLAAQTGMLSIAMLVLFLGHLLQIGLWAILFVGLGEFGDLTTAYYHSAVNFASLGYGDIVMSERWRLLGALEAGNGVLMFGLSAATLFALMVKILEGLEGAGRS